MHKKKGHNRYEPEKYWDERARKHNKDTIKAVCVDDANKSKCIDRIQRTLLKAAINYIAKHYSVEGGKVLDYGCGIGRWADFFRRYGCFYTGVDISAEMLMIAKSKHDDIDFRKVEGDYIPFPDETFDLVCSIGVIHHNNYDKQDKIISEMVRVLRFGSYLIIFEAIGKKEQLYSSTIYPQGITEWVALGKNMGLSCIWRRGARYWLLRSVVKTFLRRHSELDKNNSKSSKDPGYVQLPSKFPFLDRLITHMDVAFDPYLLPFLPTKYQTRVALIFRKPLKE